MITPPKKISFVFPYVDGSDQEWIKQWNDTFPDKQYSKVRVRTNGTLRYLLRAIDENLPWLNEVVMLVNMPSQVPSWVRGVRVVTVDKFVPSEFLPVFNSNTVEMFLPDVAGLNEQIIYSNDDFFPVRPLHRNEYFTPSGIPLISYQERTNPNSNYQKQCRRDWMTAKRTVYGSNTNYGKYIRPAHEPQPITRKLLIEAGQRMLTNRYESVTKVRDLSKNLSQYIYFDYVIAADKCLRRDKLDSFFKLTKAKLPEIEECINGNGAKWAILNDTSVSEDDAIEKIVSMLEKRFYKKCKYEE